MKNAWVTDNDLSAAQSHFASMIPSFTMPAAYSVARIDPLGLKFGHINKLNEVRPLPWSIQIFGHGENSWTHLIPRVSFWPASWPAHWMNVSIKWTHFSEHASTLDFRRSFLRSE